jgi:hypothetical protein
MKFVKVWASRSSDRKKDRDAIARTVEQSFKKTQEKLLEVMEAAWEDKQTPQNTWRKKLVKPEHLKTVSKFAKRGRLLIELLLGAIVLVDYCFDYTKTFNPSIKEEKTLLEFVRDFFRDESNFTNAWKLLEYLLRTKFWNDNGTLSEIRKKPVAGRAFLDGVVYTFHPEKVRDWAVDTIHHYRKRRGDICFDASVTEKDAALWAFRVMQHLYSTPDCKYTKEPTKFSVLYLKTPTIHEIGYQETRHAQLLREGVYSDKPQKEDIIATNKTNGKNNDNDSDNIDKESDNDKECEEKEKEQCNDLDPLSENINEAVFNFDSSDDYDNEDSNSSGTAHKTTKAAPSEIFANQDAGNIIDKEEDKDSEERQKEERNKSDRVPENNEPVLNFESNDNDDAGAKRINPIMKWKRLASKKDLENRNYVLEYLSIHRVKCTFELGKFDHIHHTRLEQVPHLLSNRFSRTTGSNKKRGGILFVPREESHVLYDYGIFRCDDVIMRKHQDLLKKVDWNLILRFLCSHGFVDSKRDKWKKGRGYAIQPLRVSVGSADHNFEHRHSEKKQSGTIWNFLRDLPRNDCGVSKMVGFHPNLPTELGKLMDFEALLLSEKFSSLNVPREGVLQDGFIYSVFTEPFVALFGCQECRFPCFDLAVMDVEEFVPEENEDFHCDGDNGILPGNDLTTTLSIFFRSKTIFDSLKEDNYTDEQATKIVTLLLHGEPDVERLKRLYMIFFTRRSHEQFRDNEAMAENLKTLLRRFRDRLNRDYKPFGGSFVCPENIWFPDLETVNDSSPVLSSECINGNHYSCFKFSPGYAREIYCAGGMTILYEANVILAHGRKSLSKMLELYIVALSMGSWFKFFFAGKEILPTIEDNSSGNLVVLLLTKMADKFGGWSGGPQHRGRPTNVDLLQHYQDATNVESAVNAMEKFLMMVETKPNLELAEFKTELILMVESLPGVDEHFGMNLGLYAGLTGLISKNLHNCFLSYPIAGQGSATTIETENVTLQAELEEMDLSGSTMERVKEIGLRSDLKGYRQTVRLLSSFCGIEQRYCWIENTCCDGIGPNKGKTDYAFPDQSIFWFHSLGSRKDDIRRMRFIVRRKQWGSQIWTDIQKFNSA